MGQYHQTFALPRLPQEKAQMFDHYSLSGGAKLCEQNYTWHYDPDYEIGGPPPGGPLLTSPCAAATALMITMGDWKHRQIVTVGDYYEGDLAALYGGPAELVQDITAQVTALTAEAFGFSFSQRGGSPWLELELPEDFKNRIEVAEAMWIGDWDRVLVARSADVFEYLRPGAFYSPPHPVASCLLGGLWPVTLIMTAVSDGLGGGDARFEIPGRWAGCTFDWMNRDHADQDGAEDITVWAMSQTEVSAHLLTR